MKNINYLNRASALIMGLIFASFLSVCLAQSDEEKAMAQYLFPKFTISKVLLKSGSTQTVPLNYNMVTEKAVYEQDGKRYDLISINTIDTVYIQERKFIPVGKVFYEVILKGNPVSAFIQQVSELMPAGTPAGYGGTSQVAATKRLSSIELSSGRYNLPLNDEYIVNPSPVYWVRKAGQSEMESFLNEKQFLKLFPEKEKELKAFIKQNKMRVTNPDHFARIIKFYNESSR
jgi:hypothetical protein